MGCHVFCVNPYYKVLPYLMIYIFSCQSLLLSTTVLDILYILVNIKKLLISKRRIGILKKLPKQGEDSESL